MITQLEKHEVQTVSGGMGWAQVAGVALGATVTALGVVNGILHGAGEFNGSAKSMGCTEQCANIATFIITCISTALGVAITTLSAIDRSTPSSLISASNNSTATQK